MNTSFRIVRLVMAAGLLTAASVTHAWDFPSIRSNAQTLYGADRAALHQIERWEQLLNDQANADIQQQLDSVNRFFNRHLRFASDQEIWGEHDYWATPVESLIRGAADCEDFTIAKYFSLIRLGIPAEQLRLTYVKSLELGQAHMVLAYYTTPDSEPLILDNLTDWIRPANRRKDLLPVYSFNAAGLWLSGGRAASSTRAAHPLPRWTDVMNKMRAEGFTSPGHHEHED